MVGLSQPPRPRSELTDVKCTFPGPLHIGNPREFRGGSAQGPETRIPERCSRCASAVGESLLRVTAQTGRQRSTGWRRGHRLRHRGSPKLCILTHTVVLSPLLMRCYTKVTVLPLKPGFLLRFFHVSINMESVTPERRRTRVLWPPAGSVVGGFRRYVAVTPAAVTDPSQTSTCMPVVATKRREPRGTTESDREVTKASRARAPEQTWGSFTVR